MPGYRRALLTVARMLDVLSGSSALCRLGGCESVSKWTDATLLEHREGFGDFGGEVAAIDVPVDMRTCRRVQSREASGHVRGERAALCEPGRVTDSINVIHSGIQRRKVRDRNQIRQAQVPRLSNRIVREMPRGGGRTKTAVVLPQHFNMRRPMRHVEQVRWSLADRPIRQMRPIHCRIADGKNVGHPTMPGARP